MSSAMCETELNLWRFLFSQIFRFDIPEISMPSGTVEELQFDWSISPRDVGAVSMHWKTLLNLKVSQKKDR